MTKSELIEAMARAIDMHTFASRSTPMGIAEAALSAIGEAGFTVVPVQPTEAMLDSGSCYEDPDGLYEHDPVHTEGALAADVYRAMIEAGRLKP